VWKTVESLDGDFYNRTIVDYLTDAPPPPPIPSAVQAELNSMTTPNIIADVGEEDVIASLKDEPQSLLDSPPVPSKPSVRDYLTRLLSPDETLEQKESIVHDLESEYPDTSPTSSLEDQERRSRLLRVLQRENEPALGEAFQAYIDSRQGVEPLVRAWTQLNSYASVCDGLSRDEILSILERADEAIGDEGDLARAIVGVWEGWAKEALHELEASVVRRIDEGFFRDFLVQRSMPKKISVSVTDVSAPTAYSSSRVARPRELEFVIAVEDSDSPGFILQRSWPELERLQSQLVKAFPQAGTVSFPRALLPSPTYKSSNELVAGLEGYLIVLLTNSNYAASGPVRAFFSREKSRSGSNLNIWNGVNRQLAKGGDFATKGLSTLSQSVSRPLNGLVKRPDGYSLAASAPGKNDDSSGSTVLGDATETIAPTAATAQSPASVKNVLADSAEPRPSTSSTISSTPVSARSRVSDELPPIPTTEAQQPSTRRDSVLTPSEFDTVLSASISLLEEAYDVQENAWSVKRTVLRLLETLLRTSYSGYIKEAFASVVESANTERFAGGIESLTESFWPNGEWWTPKEGEVGRTEEEKEKTKMEAKRLVLAQAPDGLKMALGAQGWFFWLASIACLGNADVSIEKLATTSAFSRLHDLLQDESAHALSLTLVLDFIRLLLL
jgi:hypothetical protein